TSSMVWRDSSNGTRTSRRALTSRRLARTPSPSPAIERRCPVATPGMAVPPAAGTSTTRRPARFRFRVRAVSGSICAHAASETGASSRCRLFIVFSLHRSYSERRVAHRRVRVRWRDHPRVARVTARKGGLDVVEEVRRRYEEEVACDGAAEVENAVVVSGRTTHEHVLKHRLRDAGGAAIANEIRAELAVSGTAEGHVVPEDLELLPVLLDVCERVMGVGRLVGIGELDVGELAASHDALLLLGRNGVPRLEVVEVLLHDHVTAARKRRVLGADDSRLAGGLASRILRPIDESHDVAIVE